ncbi:LamG-like jellyroll fold domain-containing protein [Microvirga subterranea]|uniref:Concanavalin A-like lectin/glucanase superfamily protein n=1 Tax=Microvirga subterranea TaxID=186651 RepID=A0A370HP79_9HYPH|nr:LamG-like jellyroll fold domain-containing protein [Microvirga subterranea]RDI58704.1 concanavalin A-like lectin/glucanase superfamily protein [Microvirga subterranea]
MNAFGYGHGYGLRQRRPRARAEPAIPDPLIRLDFNAATMTPLAVPSTGTDATPWSAGADEPALIALGQGKALRFTTTQILESAVTLPAGPFTVLLLVKNESLDGQGVYFTARSSPLPYMLWRGQPGGTALNAGTAGNGSRAVGGAVTLGVWRALCVTFDPVLPSNHLTVFIDGAPVASADAPVWDPAGSAGMLINSIYRDEGTGDGNAMILAAFEVWTGALPAPLVARRSASVAAEAGVALGRP